MRVLHVTGDNGLGGTESILRNIACHRSSTVDIAHEFLLFPPGPLLNALLQVGATAYVLGDVRLREPMTVLRARRKFAKLLKDNAYEIIVFHQYSWMPLILSDLSSKVAQVRWFHNAPRLNWTERCLPRLHRSFPDLAIYCSEYLRTELHQRGQSAVLHAPITPASIADANDRHIVRAELKTSFDSTVIVHVGRMTEMKGQSVLLDALTNLKDRPDWTCWMVGGPQTPQQSEYFRELQEKTRTAQLQERIRFTGNRTDVSRLLAAADVYCQPNLQPEAFGITFVEALYAGLPVITTGIGGAIEIVNDSCGILLSEASPEAVSEAIRKLLESESLASTLRAGTRARARQLCSADSQIRRLGQILMSVTPRS